MPTATGYFGYSAHNLGPLTTTFTAPSSCATGTDRIVYANGSSAVEPFGAPTCKPLPFADCVPSGKSWESVARQTTEFVQAVYAYYSPGVVCPSGWKTVGALAHAGKNSASASGALAERRLGDRGENVMPRALHPTEFWLNVLEPSETLAFCCPSDYGANAYGHCISTLGPRSSYTYSEICIRLDNHNVVEVSTMDGTSLTQDLISIASETINRPVETYLTDDYLTQSFFSKDLVVATWIPAVPLVYKESDLEKSGDDDTEKDGDDDDGDGKSEKSDENAASTTSPRQGVVSMLGLTLGILAGTGMLLSW